MTDLRASDADRERAAELLRHAAGEGRLTVDELDERLSAAYTTTTRADLEHLVADVRVADGDFLPDPAAAPAGGRVPVQREGKASEVILSIMGGADRRGRLRLAPRTTCINIMGGATLDLTETELGDTVAELTIFSLMGGADVYLPPRLNVEISNFAFMGGNDARLDVSHPDPGGPLLRLRLISIMGGSDIKRGPRKTRAQRRQEKRDRRAQRHELRMERHELRHQRRLDR